MRKLFEKLKNNKLLLDAVNVVMGIVLLVSLIVFAAAKAWPALLPAIWAAGLINMANGMKAMRKTKVLGQSMLLMGALILIGGTIFVLSAMGL